MSKIDTSGIAGYETMTVEEKLKALEGFEFNDGSAENKKLKDLITKANGEASSYKKQLNEKLSADEKAQAEKDALIKELQERNKQLENEKKLTEYTNKYRGLGYDDKLAASTAQAIIDGDMDTVFKNGETFKANLEQSIRANLTQNTPRPSEGGATNSAEPVTKASIMAMTDAMARQQAIADHPELFTQ